MSKKNNPAIGGDAMAFVDSLLTQDEISESDLRVALIEEHSKEREQEKEGPIMNYTKGGFPVWDDDFDKEHFTAEEITESDIRVALITERVKVRKEQGISSKGPKELSTITSR